jgi:hypothetical protein
VTDQSDPNFLDDLAREVRTLSDRLADLETQGQLAQLGLSTPARSGFDLSASPLFPGGGQILPASVIADDAVTHDSIAAGAIMTEQLHASAVIALVTNAGATVVVDAAGIVVTGGAITVNNSTPGDPNNITIIDGTSDMFRIAATGTIAKNVAANSVEAATTVSLPGLGSFPTVPGLLVAITVDTTVLTANRYPGQTRMLLSPAYAAGVSGGPVTLPISAVDITLDASINVLAGVVGVTLWTANASPTPYPNAGMRYWVLSQVAI